MEKQNSAHQLVIASLTEALLILMENKKLSDISVSELCEKAGVSRISFYRNYDYISDILTDYLSKDLENWWREKSAISSDPQDFWNELFHV